MSNPPYGKRWRLYISPQFLSSLTAPITHKVIFEGRGGGVGAGAKFVPVIATLPILGLNFIKLFCVFLWAILWFSWLRTVGKCTSRHLFRYCGLKRNNNKKSEIPDVRNHAPLKSQSLDRQSRIKNQESKSRIIRNKKISSCSVRLPAQSNFLRLRWFAVGFCTAHIEMIAVKSERDSIETS